MRGYRFALGLLLASTAVLSACGTIVDGGVQTVDVVVKGSPTAACDFTTSKFRNFGHFPNKMTVERSRENLKADCRGEQNRVLVFEVEPKVTAAGTAGNIAYGILPGVGYDAATGGMWAYPDPIIVDFRTVGEGAKPNWPENTADAQVDATRIGTADIVPPRPVRMMPIMDQDLDPALPARNQQGGTQIIDAVRIAVDENPAAVGAAATPAFRPAGRSGLVQPIVSPEDYMGEDPAAVKAQEAAKAKAAEDAQRKARDAEAARKRAAQAAREQAARDAETPAQTLPEAPVTEEAPPPESPPESPAAEPVVAPQTGAQPEPAADTAPSEGSTTVVPLGPTQLTNEPPEAEAGETQSGTSPATGAMDDYLKAQ